MQKQKNELNIIEFLERWTKIAGLIAAIVSAILFVSRSFIESVVLIIVGWALTLVWLIGIARKRSTKPKIKQRAYFGISILTIATVILTWYGIRQEAKKYIFPENSVSLPNAEYPGLAVYVDSWSSNSDAQILTNPIDRTVVVQQIDQTWLGKPINLSGDFAVLRLYIKGKGIEDQIQISNSIPVKLISYSPTTTPTDIFIPPQGGTGGADAWFFLLDLPKQIQTDSEQVFEATLNYDVQKLRQDLAAQDNLSEWPSEITKITLGTDVQPSPPDVFTLAPNEQILFSVALMFNTPGVYEFNPGIEYLYKGKKSTAWVEPSIKIEVPGSYYKWQQMGEQQDKIVVRLVEHCQFEEGTNYKCESMNADGDSSATQTADGSAMKFLVDHKTINGTDEYLVTRNIPDIDFFPSELTVWSPDHEAFALLGEEGAYLYNLADINSAVLLEHPQIDIARFSHDGNFLATGGRDGTIKLWDIQKGKLLYELEPHLLQVSALAFSPDDTFIASASQDTTLHVSRVPDGKLIYDLIANIESDPMLGSQVERIGFSPDHQIFFTQDSIGITSMWDARDGKPLPSAGNWLYDETGSRNISYLEFSPDSKYIATRNGGSGRNLELWNVQSGSLVFETPEALTATTWAAFSNDGVRLAADYGLGDEYMVVVYEIPSGKELIQLNLPSLGVQDGSRFAFSPDGSLVAFMDMDGTLLVLNGNDYSQVYSLETGFMADRLTFSKDGQTLILDGKFKQETRNMSDGSLIRVIDVSEAR